MITLRKLESLKETTRRRKYPLLLQSFEFEIKNGMNINTIYFINLLEMISKDQFYSDEIKKYVLDFKKEFSILKEDSRLWKCNSLRYKLLSAINAEPGDWDFDISESGNRTKRRVGNLTLFLDGIRSPFNVGSIFRSAESFGIEKILISNETASPEHHRAKRSSMGCTDIIPWSISSIDKLKGPVFALELGGKSLNSFSFPTEGTLLIGSEELGVSPEGLKLVEHSFGCVSIDTGGVKGSLNVSVATGIVLQKWFSTIF